MEDEWSRELGHALRQMRAAGRYAEALESQERDMLHTAQALEREAAPLTTVLRPVQDLHTTTTWEGNGATQSRARLDIYQEHTTATRRTVERLIDDLRNHAAAANGRAIEARNRQRRSRHTADQLRTLLEN